MQPDLGRAPAWVAWIAQDADGSWWGYEVEPLEYDRGWYENEIGRRVKLAAGEASAEWRRSLRPVR